ncbi:hypothetical protein OZL46_14055 [Bacillus sonorensis]|uniref:hypothetical protein n=1 Tax=Bacillus sonorensis TaxID=119858 RepID=UPI00227DDD50|nr:hypothetical protein [Bacillus sonorensis]MCY8087230.1 hypothetical protein [Bacillus sonorensis]MCZ0069548.1 hypothetical protein [Bacillus sonorensis]MCZ0096937.1 hypothetical protein [Bacillus sonorensis]MEC1517615.1 hypothetical protein [Bacillus sonorensis]
MTNRLLPGERLSPGEQLVSENRKYRFIFQTDGNLVLYENQDHTVWNTNTDGTGANRAILQTDGNFVIYATDDRPLWHTT